MFTNFIVNNIKKSIVDTSLKINNELEKITKLKIIYKDYIILLKLLSK